MALIGITSCRNTADYAQSVVTLGADARVVDRVTSVADALKGLDGLMLTGGKDVAPARYGESAHPTVNDLDPGRDEFEIALVVEARRMDLPILAICRGVQVLNVAGGGTLVQDIPSQVEGALTHRYPVPPNDPCLLAHEVRIEDGTLVARLMARPAGAAASHRVNSRHHQSVKQVGTDFRVSATAPDGVIEAIEDPHARFCVGVQWHPEHYWRTGEFRGLFEGLVAAASGATAPR